MSNVIPKEKLSAYERWEMREFEGDTPQHKHEIAQHHKDIEEKRTTAQKEGFTKGFDEGYQVGLKKGEEAGMLALQNEVAHFQALCSAWHQSLKTSSEQLAEDVLHLALDLTQHLVKTSLHANPALILPIVQAAINQLPMVKETTELLLHPDDAKRIQTQLGDALAEQQILIVADNHLQLGDCMINSRKHHIDGKLSTRWQAITEALGSTLAWTDDGHP